MTADQIEKLKALALAAQTDMSAIARFTTTFDPAGVLELIAEVERLRAEKRPKDHNIRQLVNDLRNIAETFGGTQQLRARISGAVGQFIDDSFGAAPAAGTEKDAERLVPRTDDFGTVWMVTPEKAAEIDAAVAGVQVQRRTRREA